MRVGGGILAAVILLAALATVALAKPATGHYSATGKVSFSFSIAKGRCRLPPDPSNPAAPPGAFGHGLCFRTAANLLAIGPLTCPAGTTITGQQQLEIGLFDGLRLSRSGSLVAKIYPAGDTTEYTELSLQVTGRTASGFVEMTQAGASVCDSGQLQFTAGRR